MGSFPPVPDFLEPDETSGSRLIAGSSPQTVQRLALAPAAARNNEAQRPQWNHAVISSFMREIKG